MVKTMKLSGAESMSAAANVFIGQTEAPLLVKPYLEKMSKSEMLCLMTGGMATVAGGVLAAYVGFLGGDDPVQQQMYATHLLTASIMNAPAGIAMAKISFPETQEHNVNRALTISKDKIGSNVLDALTLGILDGLKLAVNVGAMLLAFIAMIALINFMILKGVGSWTGLNDYIIEATSGKYEGFSLQFILGLIFSPIAWLMGVPSVDMTLIGQLLGEKIILNEFYAYVSLGQMKAVEALSSQKSIIIATYALCGFANFSSIGIQIGGISSLAPGQRTNLSSLGLRALLAGTLACLLTGTIAGVIV
ncbi:MAG: NupC/NupG family nucleoside CNT transporter [Bacteroidetes bacterium]|nr:MAG: NupC/NupG family nucleoside CNT transporter [Bacteroidota bacterium]